MNDSKKKFLLGFSTLDKEIHIKKLAVKGGVPEWLSGTLLRNGPAKFEAGNKKLNHWFDGFSMIHNFSFKNGEVSYVNKFLETKSYCYSKKNNKIGYQEFATDPCRSIFKKFTQLFVPEFTDNANVNISKINDKFVALTETPLPIEFDLETLNTVGALRFEDDLKESLTTAHPHFDFEKNEGINMLTYLSNKSFNKFYKIDKNSKKRKVIGKINTDEPAYTHSFGLTKNYVVLTECPLVVNPLNLLLGNKPFIENFKWKPQKGSRFILLDRYNGKTTEYITDAFFTFHHINSFEDNDYVVVDIAAYPNSNIVNLLYLDNLRNNSSSLSNGNDVLGGEFRRYYISKKDSSVKYDVITDALIEFPRINYYASNTKDYNFVYAASLDKNNKINFFDRLVKINISNNTYETWREENCYPGEPVFIPSPNSSSEDDGVIMSVILNSEKNNSFLLILDAKSFKEIARAEVPHHIPFGFHGQFYKN